MAVVVLEHESQALRGNPLGDPARRQLHLVVPDDLSSGTAVPCLWWLAGHAGVSRAMLAHDPWQEGLAERLARLTRAGLIGPMIVALPDCFTRFGGCQYLSSPAAGDYERYLAEELPALVSARYAVSAHGIAGKSSGGYGAWFHATRRPELFRALACHSADVGFELALTGELPSLMNALHEHGGLEAFVAAFDRAENKRDGRWFGPVSVLALAAAYSPDPARPLGIALPFDVARGTIDRAVWARWLAHDPLSMVEAPAVQAALRKLALLYLDCGDRDEFHLHWGARALHRRLTELGVPHEHQEWKGGHRNTAHRLDVSLPRLYRALAGEG